ncbi:MAG: hypothetical protein EBQ76_06910 [Betaproteobacteria bacterium]|nr:hypothetical protein [Betaproteobacteria bacterium]
MARALQCSARAAPPYLFLRGLDSTSRTAGRSTRKIRPSPPHRWRFWLVRFCFEMQARCSSCAAQTPFDPFVNGQPKPGDFPTGPNSPKLTQGALEGSSVNPITALVGLIDAERSFESGIRFIKQAKEIDESGSQLLKA